MKLINKAATILVCCIIVVFSLASSVNADEVKYYLFGNNDEMQIEPRIYRCTCAGETKKYTVDIFVEYTSCTHVKNPTDKDMVYDRYDRYNCASCGSYLGSTYIGRYVYCYN